MTLGGRSVLVTGGAGFVGSHLTDRLVAAGARVRILDDLSTGDEANLNPAADFARGDVRDEAVVASALDGIEVVYHLAAQINPAAAVSDPMFDFDVNVRGTLVLLLAGLRVGLQRFVMASTNLYGNADVPVMSESLPTLATPRTLLSPYAAAKASAEAYLKVFNDELGLPTVRLRFTNVYGPRQLTKSESGVVAIFVQEALAGRPLRVFGDGAQTRDFVYVSDVVDGLVAACAEPRADGGVFNLGFGEETSVNALAAMIVRLTGAEVPIRNVDVRAADFARVRADLTQARDVLGFEPSVGLEEGLARYIDWYRSRAAR